MLNKCLGTMLKKKNNPVLKNMVQTEKEAKKEEHTKKYKKNVLLFFEKTALQNKARKTHKLLL